MSNPKPTTLTGRQHRQIDQIEEILRDLQRCRQRNRRRTLAAAIRAVVELQMREMER